MLSRKICGAITFENWQHEVNNYLYSDEWSSLLWRRKSHWMWMLCDVLFSRCERSNWNHMYVNISHHIFAVGCRPSLVGRPEIRSRTLRGLGVPFQDGWRRANPGGGARGVGQGEGDCTGGGEGEGVYLLCATQAWNPHTQSQNFTKSWYYIGQRVLVLTDDNCSPFFLAIVVCCFVWCHVFLWKMALNY